jgi:hypothetical protein
MSCYLLSIFRMPSPWVVASLWACEETDTPIAYSDYGLLLQLGWWCFLLFPPNLGVCSQTVHWQNLYSRCKIDSYYQSTVEGLPPRVPATVPSTTDMVLKISWTRTTGCSDSHGVRPVDPVNHRAYRLEGNGHLQRVGLCRRFMRHKWMCRYSL